MIRGLLVISIGVNIVTWIGYWSRIQRHEEVIAKHLQLAYHMNATLMEHGIEPSELALQTLKDFGIRSDQ